jgi:hypothetical protein
MIITLYIAAAVIMAVGSLYFAWRNRDFRKFLSGAFFVSSGILFYLFLADVSVPLLGTSFVETPQISGGPLHRPFHPLFALFPGELGQHHPEGKRVLVSSTSSQRAGQAVGAR